MDYEGVSDVNEGLLGVMIRATEEVASRILDIHSDGMKRVLPESFPNLNSPC